MTIRDRHIQRGHITLRQHREAKRDEARERQAKVIAKGQTRRWEGKEPAPLEQF